MNRPEASEPTAPAVSRYRLERRLGSGAEGVVFAAHDPKLDRHVAIKLFRAGESSPEARVRLVREAKALAQLPHPNIVPVYDVGTYDWRSVGVPDEWADVSSSGFFIVMEHVRGCTLADWLETEERTDSEVIEMFLECARALAHAHEHGIVHRDFKPSNVLVAADGRPRVLDFGLARTMRGRCASTPASSMTGEHDRPWAIGQEQGSLTAPGCTVGTPRYMSPEQASGHGVDERTDQFAFCVVLIETLSGRKLPTETIRRLRFGRPANLPGPPHVPADVLSVIRRGLSYQPDDRHPSMRALIAELQRTLDPGRGARRVAMAGFGSTAAVVVATLVVSSSDAQCDSDELLASWGAQHKDASRRSLGEAAMSSSGPAWEAAAGNLDAYAQRWIQQRRLACEQIQDASADASVVDRRMQCLEERRRHFVATVDAFVSVRPESLSDLVVASAKLPPPVVCSDEEFLRSTAPLPANADVSHRVDQYRGDLAQVWALSHAGEARAATRHAKDLLSTALDLGYVPLIVDAELVWAELKSLVGDTEDAAQTLEAAYARAVGAGLHVLAGRAAVARLDLALDEAAVDERADRWRRHARAQIERSGSPDGLAARFELASGRLAHDGGDYEAAIAHYARADALFESWWGGPNPHSAICWVNTAGTFLEQRRWDEAVAQLERAEPELRRSFGDGHPSLVGVQLNLGSAYTGQGRPADALAAHRRAVDAASHVPGHPLAGQVRGALADSLILNGRWAEAAHELELAQEAIRRISGPDHPLVGYVLSSRASVAAKQGDYEEAVRLDRQAIELLERRGGPDSVRILPPLGNLGMNLRAGGQLEEAVRVLERALAGYAPSGQIEGREAIIVSINLAGTQLDLGQPDDALALLDGLAEILDRVAPGDSLMTRIHYEHGRARQLQGDHAAAAQLLRTAIASGEHDPARTTDVAKARFELARCLWSSGKRGRARAAAVAVLESLEDGDAPDLRAAVSSWVRAHQGRPVG